MARRGSRATSARHSRRSQAAGARRERAGRHHAGRLPLPVVDRPFALRGQQVYAAKRAALCADHSGGRAGADVETQPTVALAATLNKKSEVHVTQPWQAELLASFWPLNTDGVLAIACCKLVARINLSGTFLDPTEAWMASLHTPDRGWSEMARTALWLAAASRNDRLRGTAVDALIEAIADGRAGPGTLAETLLHVASGGWLTLTRLADSLREVARTSVLAERIVAEILDRLIASWAELPRDGHAILALQVGLLSKMRQAASDEARTVLAQVKGSGKAAKLAKQLCRFGN